MNIKDINYRCADLLNNPCEFNEFINKDELNYKFIVPIYNKKKC
jgi:hypothetical protein